MQRHGAQQKVRIFGFHQQWHDCVCSNLQIACRVNQFQSRRLISADINRVHSGLKIFLPCGISDLNPVELWKRAILATRQFPVDGQFGVVDCHWKFFAAHGKCAIIGHLQHSIASRFAAFGLQR